nr:hypothetical protein [Tanacetum cinerariifolium]
MFSIGSFSPTKDLLKHSLTSSTPTPYLDRNGLTFFHIDETIFRVHEFFASFKFDATPCREGVVCNIPYWLAKYLKSVRDKSVIFRGMFMTRIAQSFGLLTNEMVSVLNREPPPHVYKKTSLVKIGVVIELHEGECFWLATRGVLEESEGDDEEGNREGETKELGAPRIFNAT